MSQFTFDSSRVSPRDVVSVLFKHKWAILLVYITFCGLVGAYCFFWPPTYEARVRILVKNDRQEPVISPERDGVRMISRLSVTEDDLNSEMAIITSSAVLEQTARDEKLDTIPEHWLVRLLNAPLETLSEAYNSYHHKPNLDRFGKAVGKLARRVAVEPEKKSAIVTVKLRWGDPQFAESLLQRLCANYFAQHLAVHKAPDTQNFFRDQVQAKKLELTRIEQQIEAVRPGATTGTLSLEKELYLKQASDFESESRKTRALLSEARARIQAGSEEIKGMPERMITEEKTMSNPLALGNLKTRVLDLQLKHTELLQKYKPEQPLVQQSEEQLSQARQMLDRELAGSTTDRSTNINPVGQALQQDLALNRTKVSGFEALGSAMDQAYRESQSRLDEIARNAYGLQRFERERKAIELSLAAYQKQYEDARANDQMNELHLINVAAIEPVRSGADPVKPNRGLLMKVALGLGILIGIGFGFLLELLDQTMRSERDVEFSLGMPVIATLGYYEREVRV